MRAAILLLPFAAFAGILSAGALQIDPYGDNAMAEAHAMNAAEEAAADMEPGANDMTMDMDANMVMDMSSDMNMTTTNMAAPQRPRPAWMGGDFWLIAAEEPSGAIWYFAPFESDFDASPHRVMLRTDETRDPARRHNNTQRTIELDCRALTYRVVSTAHFDDAGRRTDVVEDVVTQMARPAPGSAWAAVVAEVCRHVAYHDAQRRGNEVTFNGI